MAEQNPLKPLFQDIADAIREKESSSLSIVAEDFPERIRNLPTSTELPDDLCTITVISNNASAGTVEGSCIASKGATITVKATIINQEFQLQGWFDGETELSASEEYTFVVTESRTLVARFKEPDIVLPAGYTKLYYLDFPYSEDVIRYTSISIPMTQKINNLYQPLSAKIKYSRYPRPLGVTTGPYLCYMYRAYTNANGNVVAKWDLHDAGTTVDKGLGVQDVNGRYNYPSLAICPRLAGDKVNSFSLGNYFRYDDNPNTIIELNFTVDHVSNNSNSAPCHFSANNAVYTLTPQYYMSYASVNETMYLFHDGTTKSTSYKKCFSGKIFDIKFEYDTAVYYHLVPAKRNSDGVCGLYDVINNQFYTSLGEPFIGA